MLASLIVISVSNHSILNVFKRWIDSQFEGYFLLLDLSSLMMNLISSISDLLQDSALLAMLRSFIEKDIIAAGFQSWGKNLTSLVNAKVLKRCFKQRTSATNHEP